MRYHFKIEFNEDFINILSFYYTSKVCLPQRLVKGKHYNSSTDEDLYLVIKKKYQEAFSCSQKIKKFIENNYTYELTEEEVIYLTIHIERVVKNNETIIGCNLTGKT
ncbi:PRD domain-containing protein [Bacillus cytotoxicus]|uniref:PRD domain-containing protein n=1 Tax=Bacillus cytotoxicus TaxID=580165 RepID=UPI003B968C67